MKHLVRLWPVSTPRRHGLPNHHHFTADNTSLEASGGSDNQCPADENRHAAASRTSPFRHGLLCR